MTHEEYYQKFLDKIAPIRTEHYKKLATRTRNKQALIADYEAQIRQIFYENYPKTSL